jgi:hypothetical protein
MLVRMNGLAVGVTTGITPNEKYSRLLAVGACRWTIAMKLQPSCDGNELAAHYKSGEITRPEIADFLG